MIDLHIHSTASDGQYSPTEIVKLAVEKKLQAIALTDHDTVDGLKEASKVAQRFGIKFIPGIELSAQGVLGVKELHILGYWIDSEQKELKELCRRGQILRWERAEKIYNYLAKQNVPVEPKIVERFAGNAPIGRPHFAQAMVEMGYASNTRQAFDLFLDTPEFKQIPRPLPTAKEGIQTILKVGGVPVLAHPIQTRLSQKDLEQLLIELKTLGVQGLECYYSTHSLQDTEFYLKLARNYDFLVTGGSDFHGERIKPSIQMGSGIDGKLSIPDDLEILHIKGVRTVEYRDDISRAMELFDRQKYREAFAAFADIYNHCQDLSKKHEIFQMLEEAYYTPNIEELKNNYEHNRAVLKEYPYIWGEDFPKFEDLDFQLFPASDEIFYCYAPKEDCFSDEYDAKTSNRMRYFFENLDEPIQIEDEDNFYNLTFLNDNVRASEDFAGDNHVYLFYTSRKPLERLMQTCDLEPILQQEKFVFLIGKENWTKYPIDFKKEFLIDYSKMSPQKLRIEEMKRICYWWKRGYAGAMFGLDVLNKSPYIMMKFGLDLHQKSYYKERPIFALEEFYKILENTKKRYSIKEIESFCRRSDIQLNWPDDRVDFIRWLRSSEIRHQDFTLPELFRVYFIYAYHKEKSSENPRVVPLILWEPHINMTGAYESIVLEFPYRMVLNSMREPVMLTGRIYEREGSIFPYSDYTLAYDMHQDLREQYYAYRFEDLKQYPDETCQALCEQLNIPYDKTMLESDNCMTTEQGEMVRGFDLAPLHRNLEKTLSKFDQVRLQIFYDPILRHYEYPSFDFEECPMSDQDILFLLKFPFRFERGYVESGKWEKITVQDLRQRLYQNMAVCWQRGQIGDMVLPKVIFPKLTKKKEVGNANK